MEFNVDVNVVNLTEILQSRKIISLLWPSKGQCWPCLPGTTCVCQHHKRETTVLRGRLCPPPQLAWTNPPGKSNTHRELITHTCSTHSGITDMSHMEVLSNLIPESDLPGVPARNPCGEQSLHVAHEHHPVYTVVLTTGLLVDTKIERDFFLVTILRWLRF